MPIFEFYCPENNRIYSFLARSQAYTGKVPRCPDNAAFRLQKRPSRFAITKKRGEEESEGDANDPFAGMSDAEMERIMGELEKDFNGMDETNPDPRQLGRLMRRFTQLTGKDMPGPLQEMVDRLEKGEDPDALEEEFAGVLDDEEMDWFSSARSLGRHLGRPTRDPKLYDIAEYVEP